MKSLTNISQERLIIESVTGLLKKNFPIDLQNTLLKHEADGTIDDPEYLQAKMLFYSQVLCRVNPLPADMMASIVSSSQDTTVNHTMYALLLL
jgi:L-proline amide hydrolase